LCFGSVPPRAATAVAVVTDASTCELPGVLVPDKILDVDPAWEPDFKSLSPINSNDFEEVSMESGEEHDSMPPRVRRLKEKRAMDPERYARKLAVAKTLSKKEAKLSHARAVHQRLGTKEGKRRLIALAKQRFDTTEVGDGDLVNALREGGLEHIAKCTEENFREWRIAYERERQQAAELKALYEAALQAADGERVRHRVAEERMSADLLKNLLPTLEGVSPGVRKALQSDLARRYNVSEDDLTDLAKQLHSPSVPVGAGRASGFVVKAREMETFSGPKGSEPLDKLLSTTGWLRSCQHRVSLSQIATQPEERQVAFVADHFVGDCALWYQGYRESRERAGNPIATFGDLLAALIDHYVGLDPFPLLNQALISIKLTNCDTYTAFRTRFEQICYAHRSVAPEGREWPDTTVVDVFLGALHHTKYYENVCVDPDTRSRPTTVQQALRLADERHRILTNLNQGWLRKKLLPQDEKEKAKSKGKGNGTAEGGGNGGKNGKAKAGKPKRKKSDGDAPAWTRRKGDVKQQLLTERRCFNCTKPLATQGHPRSAKDCAAAGTPFVQAIPSQGN
jgi:hypothetical protein